MSREGRLLAGYAVLLLGSACSVYSSSLVDDTAPITQGGSSASTAGKGADTAGKSGSEGGTSAQEPGGGGQGGEPDTGGTSGSGAVSGTDTGGTGNTGGVNSGGAGATGTAGTGGTGGPINQGKVLDGFEDNDLTLVQVSGRGGVWYTFHDKTTGTMTPSPLACTAHVDAPTDLGMYGMHITATGFSDYGSGLGVDFRAGKKLYDASEYTGIRFWAKVASGKNRFHRVQIADINTDAAGMECDPATTAEEGTKCEDHFGGDYEFTAEWQQYTLEFSKATQLGWGYPGPDSDLKLQSKSLYGLQITAKKSLAVDLWIDQIEFY